MISDSHGRNGINDWHCKAVWNGGSRIWATDFLHQKMNERLVIYLSLIHFNYQYNIARNKKSLINKIKSICICKEEYPVDHFFYTNLQFKKITYYFIYFFRPWWNFLNLRSIKGWGMGRGRGRGRVAVGVGVGGKGRGKGRGR